MTRSFRLLQEPDGPHSMMLSADVKLISPHGPAGGTTSIARIIEVTGRSSAAVRNAVLRAEAMGLLHKTGAPGAYAVTGMGAEVTMVDPPAAPKGPGSHLTVV